MDKDKKVKKMVTYKECTLIKHNHITPKNEPHLKKTQALFVTKIFHSILDNNLCWILLHGGAIVDLLATEPWLDV